MDRRGSESDEDNIIAEFGGLTRAPQSSNILLKNVNQNSLARLCCRVTWIDRWLTKKMLDIVGNPPIRVYLWDNNEVTTPIENPRFTLHYHNRSAVLKTIVNPELHWGDLYSDGEVDFEGDIVKFMEIILHNIKGNGKGSLLRQIVLWLGHRRINNSHHRARENIHHHYDIGNDFYKLWLDNEVMQYTCAYFAEPKFSLEQAQIAKLHHICRKLRLKPGDKVVEAGCGWGGLALFMAKNYGAKVRAYNISTEQVKYASEKAASEGLSDQVEFVLDDYRNIKGEYDVFVSVGMLEHVGNRDYPTLGNIINRCLKPHGRGLIHAVGKNVPGPMNAWLERRIFPGAYPPTIKQMMKIFESGDFSVVDIENLRLHYAKTLKRWSQRFEQNKVRVEQMFDRKFVKAWRLYLAGTGASFSVGHLQLFQVVFTPAKNNEIPWSRVHIYTKEIIPEIQQDSSIEQG